MKRLAEAGYQQTVSENRQHIQYRDMGMSTATWIQRRQLKHAYSDPNSQIFQVQVPRRYAQPPPYDSASAQPTNLMQTRYRNPCLSWTLSNTAQPKNARD